MPIRNFYFQRNLANGAIHRKADRLHCINCCRCCCSWLCFSLYIFFFFLSLTLSDFLSCYYYYYHSFLTENLALMTVAAQSSTHNVSSGAENAVDENRNPLFDVNGNCALTNQGNPIWWRVDLGTNSVPVSDVFIVNRLFPPSAPQTNGDYTITLGEK